MDGEEQIVTQLGLLLTQVRYSRMALENIERATTRYAGIAVSIPGGATAAALGAPPLIDGALKVYVVNINDLTAGGPGIGDVLAGVIGGAGRFLGGFFGGLVGGTVSGVAFPYLLAQVARIVDTLERIVNRIGLPSLAEGGKPRGSAGDGEGQTILGQVGSLAETLRLVAKVFDSAAAGGQAQPPAVTRNVNTVLDLCLALTRVVDGLILLVPILMGALASFLIKLDDIKLAVVGLLQFALRNVFLLRAAVLATVLDTLSLAGRLAGGILGIVAGAVDAVLGSIFRVIGAGLETVFTALQVASAGLKGTIDQLMLFLRDGVGALLVFLGNLRIFRLVFHLAEVLPLVLPAIARIMDKPLSKEETEALQAAARIAPPSGAGAPTPMPIAQFPDLAATLLPPAAQSELLGSVSRFGRTLREETRGSFDAVQGAMTQIGNRVRTQIGTLDEGLDRELTDRLGRAKVQAGRLAESLQAAEDVAKRRPSTGLEAIASAYEGWLRGGGMATLMGQIERHFRETPTDVAAGGRTIAGRVVTSVLDAEAGRSVTVEIDEVTIDLGEQEARHGAGEAAAPTSFDADGLEYWRQNTADRMGVAA